ncbi:uncharacterized protein LOC109860710 [Pseudomyrmex gracilis]|uniref:uncharacterized protein LOC109860710 n=1 Tax=Pseudomyrmex gracilis TaxID=219809 RepID=UPI00099562A3|nr:uncharacterized protein LOC109860710 [Pseudomyrmex gracilis]
MLPDLRDIQWKETRYNYVATLDQKWESCMAHSYYTINRILLLSIGLWPYQGSSSRRIVITFMTVVLFSSIVIQLTTFVTTECDVDVFLHVSAHCIPWLAYTLKYNVLCLNVKKLRDIMERIRSDWIELNNAQEIEIIKKYSAFGKFITIGTVLFMCASLCGYILLHVILNYILDYVTAANESRSRPIPIKVEYFVDQQKYYALIMSHIFLFVLSGFMTVIATETLLMSYAQHACGLFEIAKFVEMTAENFKSAYMVLLPLGVTSMSINLYRLSYLLKSENYYELVVSLVFVLGHIWYNTKWYTTSLKAQKLLWIVMQRTMRHCVITIGGLFAPSFEGFAMLMSTSVSYFMVLLSIQDS